MTNAPIILVPGFWLGAWAWDEVAALLAWVCSPESAGVTGAVLPVDAGMSAR